MTAGQSDTQRVRHRVAAQVRRLRVGRQMTQEAAAGAADITVRHFRKVEAGEVNLTLDTLVKVATALGVDVAELLQRRAGEGEG